MSILPYLVAGWLFLVGLYGIVTSRNYVHAIGCLTVIQSSTYVLLLSVGYRSGLGAPIFSDHPPGPAADPVLQALVLTDIVVGAAVSALLLSLALQLQKKRGSINPDDLQPARD
ncbi:multicomponent Na+:H+ antiporter subunit C [Faunimonas pinastri]|uniref:Multicomponent Na+:H+ antiporter subunit C n=1 Tax=Faunimonas pinastri TaxID=1855383 RepID=A0A1H9LGC0_9HYPH|nr:cation:proton antiporter subunit C [Faunimonas pinastri]SER10247.1 multicomponent Na+:H+ antiporter subunit C [Faunimonas pinastri]